MTVDTPLSCYICGETSDRATVDMLGCLKDQAAARERYIEKHGRNPQGFIDICPDCQDSNPNHAHNTYKKYGKYE